MKKKLIQCNNSKKKYLHAIHIKAWFFSKILPPTSGHHSENNSGQELFFLAWVIYEGLKSPEMPPFKHISPSAHPFCRIHPLVYPLLTCQQCPAQLASTHFLEKAQPNSLMKHKSLFASPSPLSKFLWHSWLILLWISTCLGPFSSVSVSVAGLVDGALVDSQIPTAEVQSLRKGHLRNHKRLQSQPKPSLFTDHVQPMCSTAMRWAEEKTDKERTGSYRKTRQ